MERTEGAARLAGELAPRLARLIITLRRETAAAGLSRVQLTLLAALRRGESRRITELADLEQITQPSMTALVSRMERAGWVRREPDPNDRRGVRVTITEAGERQYDAGLAGYVEALAGRLHKLDETQRIALQQAISALDLVLEEGSAEPANGPAT
ncbi:MAG TPA: MarR family transcriptional regulator [Mycobacteriales bacterium]|jgi:DNA-binding MarR family transcriptional regulator|nr:MarR family transcriptional regulator [Mycobacteriales bacterium]